MAKLDHHAAFERGFSSTRQWKIRIQADSSCLSASREEIPRHNPAGAIGSDQKVADLPLPVDIDLDSAVHLPHSPNRPSITELGASRSRTQAERLIEPIAPDHVGHRRRECRLDRLATAVGERQARDPLFNEASRIDVEQLLHAPRQTSAAGLVARQPPSLQQEHSRACLRQPTGSRRPGRPSPYDDHIVSHPTTP
jgi:hypothetical protein